MRWSTQAAADCLSHAVRPPVEHLYDQIRRAHRGTRSVEARSRRGTTRDAKLQLGRKFVPSTVVGGSPCVLSSSVLHFLVEACLVPDAPLAPPAASSPPSASPAAAAAPFAVAAPPAAPVV